MHSEDLHLFHQSCSFCQNSVTIDLTSVGALDSAAMRAWDAEEVLRRLYKVRAPKAGCKTMAY